MKRASRQTSDRYWFPSWLGMMMALAAPACRSHYPGAVHLKCRWWGRKRSAPTGRHGFRGQRWTGRGDKRITIERFAAADFMGIATESGASLWYTDLNFGLEALRRPPGRCRDPGDARANRPLRPSVSAIYYATPSGGASSNRLG